MNRLDAALKIALLYPVFPCGGSGLIWKVETEARAKGKNEDEIRELTLKAWKKPRCKWGTEATQDESVIRAWWSKRGWEDANIGVPTGRKSGLFVIDLDVNATEDGRVTAQAIGEAIGQLPQTLTVATASGGEHRYYQMREDLVEASIAARTLGPGIDWRGEGGFVVVPPSSDPRGKWRIAERREIAELPAAWVGMIHDARGKKADAPAAPEGKIPEGQRHDRLLSAAGKFVNMGLRGPALLEALRGWNLDHCATPIDDAELAEQSADFSARFSETLPNTDAGNGARFTRRYAEQLRYVSATEKWLEWNGVVWGEVSRECATSHALDLVGELRVAATLAEDKAAEKWAHQTGGAGRIAAMRDLGRARLAVNVDALDADPAIIACRNFTLSLAADGSHEWRRADPVDLCTVVAGVNGGDVRKLICPAWEDHLDRVLPDAEVRGFFQRAVGYSLVGGQSSKCLFIVYGPGDSGKSATMRAVEALFGGYARATTLSTFGITTSGPNAGASSSPALADLAGARLVHIPEIPRDRGLAADLVKKWTGGDTIQARALYGHPFTFAPLGKLWFVGNRMPTMDVDDEAAWRRVRLIHFPLSIPKAEQNKKIEETWNREAILAWALEGWRRYCAEGLEPPQSAQRDADAEREEANPIREFVDECVRHVPGQSVSFRKMEESYSQWCRGRDRKRIGHRGLSDLLHAEKFERKRLNAGWVWLNTQLSFDGQIARGVLQQDAPQ